MVLVISHPEAKRSSGRSRLKTEPRTESGNAHTLLLLAHAESDEWLVVLVTPELERREELQGQLVVAGTIDSPEGGSEPDPLSQTDKVLANPECLEGVEIDTASVLELTLQKRGKWSRSWVRSIRGVLEALRTCLRMRRRRRRGRVIGCIRMRVRVRRVTAVVQLIPIN
jgi:hypothetical protein